MWTTLPFSWRTCGIAGCTQSWLAVAAGLAPAELQGQPGHGMSLSHLLIRKSRIWTRLAFKFLITTKSRFCDYYTPRKHFSVQHSASATVSSTDSGTVSQPWHPVQCLSDRAQHSTSVTVSGSAQRSGLLEILVECINAHIFCIMNKYCDTNNFIKEERNFALSSYSTK